MTEVMWVPSGRSYWKLCVDLPVACGEPFVFGNLGIRFLFLGEVVGGGVNLYIIPGETLEGW